MTGPADVVVATASRLLRVRPAEAGRGHAVEVLHEGHGFYYGLTYDESTLYALCRNYWNGRAGRHSLLRFDRRGRLLGEDLWPEGELGEGHQMMLWRGLLYACNTQRNCLSVFDLLAGTCERFYPLPGLRDKNYSHLNSVYVDGERLLLGFANRFRDGFTLHFDFATRRLVAADALGLAAHNVVPYRDGTLLCSSLNGCLMYRPTGFDDRGQERPLCRVLLLPDEEDAMVDRITIHRIPARHFHGGFCYPRGLAVCGETAYVGLSEFGKRSSRRDSAGRLLILDDLAGLLAGGPARVRVVDLGRTGAVCEVRVLNRPDLGHPVPPAGLPSREAA